MTDIHITDDVSANGAPGGAGKGQLPKHLPFDISGDGMGYAGRGRRKHFRRMNIGAGKRRRHAEGNQGGRRSNAVRHAQGAIDQLRHEPDQYEKQKSFVHARSPTPKWPRGFT